MRARTPARTTPKRVWRDGAGRGLLRRRGAPAPALYPGTCYDGARINRRRRGRHLARTRMRRRQEGPSRVPETTYPAGWNVEVRADSSAASMRHLALVYRDPGEYANVVSGFLQAGLAAGARGFAMVPAARHADLRAAMNSGSEDLVFADMTGLGANPARIIPVIESFVGDGRGPVRVVAEPIWPGRTSAENREATKHEALINLAFAGRDV